MKVDGAGVVHHLTRLTHIGGAEIQDDVWKEVEKKAEAKLNIYLSIYLSKHWPLNNFHKWMKRKVEITKDAPRKLFLFELTIFKYAWIEIEPVRGRVVIKIW